jgi:hypothetical protein
MRSSIAQLAAVLEGAILFAGCASANTPPMPGPPASMTIVNQSQFDLEELRISTSESYVGVKNVYPGVMKQNAELVFYGSGSWYVTTLRVKYDGGPLLAFTTSESLDLQNDRGYELQIFDQSFRFKEDGQRLEPNQIAESVPISGDPKYTMGTQTTTTSTTTRSH